MEYTVEDGNIVRADGSGPVCCGNPNFQFETEEEAFGDRLPSSPDVLKIVTSIWCTRCGWKSVCTLVQKKGHRLVRTETEMLKGCNVGKEETRDEAGASGCEERGAIDHGRSDRQVAEG